MTTGANRHDLLSAGAVRDLAAMKDTELVELYEALAEQSSALVGELTRTIEEAISPVTTELQRRKLR